MPTETPRDTQVINAYLNARDRAIRAEQQLNGRPKDERLFYREQYRRIEATHARNRMIQVLKVYAWNEAHDTLCDSGRDCDEHENPYVTKDEDD